MPKRWTLAHQKFQACQLCRPEGSSAKVIWSVHLLVRNIMQFKPVGIPYGPEVDKQEAQSGISSQDRGLLFVRISLLSWPQSINAYMVIDMLSKQSRPRVPLPPEKWVRYLYLYGRISTKYCTSVSLGQQPQLSWGESWIRRTCAWAGSCCTLFDLTKELRSDKKSMIQGRRPGWTHRTSHPRLLCQTSSWFLLAENIFWVHLYLLWRPSSPLKRIS